MKKIVIKVHAESDKRKSKALQIAAKSQGQVQSLSLEGESGDIQLVVTGDGVDVVRLTNQMRKKFRYALLSVEDVEEGGDDGGEQEDGDDDDDETTINLPPYPTYSYVVYDSYSNSCSIL